MNKKLFFAILLVAVLVFSGSANAVEVSETFDTNPGWLELGNTIGDCDFGFSNTSNASGSAGEMGGYFERVGMTNLSYYGVDLGGRQ